MFAAGWIDEVRAVLAAGVDPNAKPLQSVGYAQVVAHVRAGETASRDEAIEAVRLATVAFAKRQRTWFRGERGVTWVTADAARTDAWVERIARWFRGERD